MNVLCVFIFQKGCLKSIQNQHGGHADVVRPLLSSVEYQCKRLGEIA